MYVVALDGVGIVSWGLDMDVRIWDVATGFVPFLNCLFTSTNDRLSECLALQSHTILVCQLQLAPPAIPLPPFQSDQSSQQAGLTDGSSSFPGVITILHCIATQPFRCLVQFDMRWLVISGDHERVRLFEEMGSYLRGFK